FASLTIPRGLLDLASLPVGGRDAYNNTCTDEVDGTLDVRSTERRLERVLMKNIKYAPVRIGVAIATVVALVSSVGAPFKWSMILPPLPWN
ncbi:MAG: hypothetical protein ACXVJ3_17345, partial [Ilumatobacteraceae bacterium]